MDRQKLNEMESKHFACVYKLVFPDGKIYVGKSKDIGKRVRVYKMKVYGVWTSETNSGLYEAIRECGMENVGMDILFRMNSASGVDCEKDMDYALGIVERRWIIELKSNDPAIGYNKTEGGEMFGIRGVERVVDVVKKNYVYEDVIVPRQKQENGVRVVAYDINGDYYGEWPSRVAFTREVIGSQKSTMGLGEWRKGFIIYRKEVGVAEKVESYAEYIERTKAAAIEAKRVLEEKVGKIKVERSVRLQRGVVMCGMDYEEIGRYDNVRDAADKTGLRYSSIYTVLKNGRGTVSGYHFYYSDEWDEDKTACLVASSKRAKQRHASKFGKIYQYDYEFNEVGVYASTTEAAEKTGNSAGCILAAAKKGGKSMAGGYHWRIEKDRIVKDAVDEQKSSLDDVEF